MEHNEQSPTQQFNLLTLCLSSVPLPSRNQQVLAVLAARPMPRGAVPSPQGELRHPSLPQEPLRDGRLRDAEQEVHPTGIRRSLQASVSNPCSIRRERNHSASRMRKVVTRDKHTHQGATAGQHSWRRYTVFSI